MPDDYIKRRRYLYHVTESENVKSILRDGLIRGGGKRTALFVCLSEKPLSWWGPGYDILKVDIKGLPGEFTTWLPASDEVCYWGDIPAYRIKVYEPNTVELIRMGDAYTKAIINASREGHNAD